MRIGTTSLLLAGALLCAISPTHASAEIWAYTDPAGQGVQNWGGNLGLDFYVNSHVTIYGLGIFNASGSNSILGGPIQVAIYDSSGVLMTPIVQFLNSTTYTVAPGGYDLVQDVLPVVLGAGSYSVVAVGFSSLDLNGNINNGSSSGPITDDGTGALTFTGYRWDYSTTLARPTAFSGSTINQFDAGTFLYGTPEPGTFGLLALGVTGFGFMKYRFGTRSAEIDVEAGK